MSHALMLGEVVFFFLIAFIFSGGSSFRGDHDVSEIGLFLAIEECDVGGMVVSKILCELPYVGALQRELHLILLQIQNVGMPF